MQNQNELVFETIAKTNGRFGRGIIGDMSLIIDLESGLWNVSDGLKSAAGPNGNVKIFKAWNRTQRATTEIEAVSEATGISKDKLLITITNCQNDYKGTYAHEKLLIMIMQWASPVFSVHVSNIVLAYSIMKESARRDEEQKKQEAELAQAKVRNTELRADVNKNKDTALKMHDAYQKRREINAKNIASIKRLEKQVVKKDRAIDELREDVEDKDKLIEKFIEERDRLSKEIEKIKEEYDEKHEEMKEKYDEMKEEYDDTLEEQRTVNVMNAAKIEGYEESDRLMRRKIKKIRKENEKFKDEVNEKLARLME